MMVASAQDASPRKMGWAIRHNGSVLGYANSRPEAEAILRDLQNWIEDQGGGAELSIGEPPMREWRLP